MVATIPNVLREGAATLTKACIKLGFRPSNQAFFWLLGQALGESALGGKDLSFMPRAKQFQGTNNWGAVFCTASGPKPAVSKRVKATCVKGTGDVTPGGHAFIPSITKYKSQVDGAEGFVSLIIQFSALKNVLESDKSTSLDYARELYKIGYFGGFFCGLDGEKSINGGQIFQSACEASANDPSKAKFALETQAEADKKNIAAYAAFVDSGANQAIKAIGSSIPPLPKNLSTLAKVGIATGIVGITASIVAVLARK